MGKVMNTKWFIDKNARLIRDMYLERLGSLEELTSADLSRPEVVKGLTELRLYHLPPYFQITTALKGRIQTQSSTCYGLENIQKATEVERELMSLHSVLWLTRTRHEPCSNCGTRRASKDGICWKCAEGDDRELSKQYNSSISSSKPEALWTSPKKSLLAATKGCVHCYTVLPIIDQSEIWTGDLASDWSDGLCPSCQPRHPLGETWSLPKEARRNTPIESYSQCQVCLSDHLDYALWGMCEGCYQEWQDFYVEPTNLYKFVDQYGALAALLIRPSIDWLVYLRNTLEHKYCWNPHEKNFPEHAKIDPKPMGFIQAKLNIKEMVNDSIRASKSKEKA